MKRTSNIFLENIQDSSSLLYTPPQCSNYSPNYMGYWGVYLPRSYTLRLKLLYFYVWRILLSVCVSVWWQRRVRYMMTGTREKWARRRFAGRTVNRPTDPPCVRVPRVRTIVARSIIIIYTTWHNLARRQNAGELTPPLAAAVLPVRWAVINLIYQLSRAPLPRRIYSAPALLRVHAHTSYFNQSPPLSPWGLFYILLT